MESYTEFMEELREKVAEKLGEGYETEIHQIAKANEIGRASCRERV